MQQNADAEPTQNGDEAQDSFRQEIQQIIAQRLERSNLKKTRPETASIDTPTADEPALIRNMPIRDGETVRTAPPNPEPHAETDATPLEQAFADDLALERFKPALPEDRPQPTEPSQRFVERRRGERRQGDRRNMEFLRTELQWSSSPESKKRSLFSGGAGFKPSRIMLLAVAALSAAVAVGLVLIGSTPPAPEPEPVVVPVSVPTTRVLVATASVGAGQRLTRASLGWQEMPDADLLPGFISAESKPDAITSFAQSVARFPLFPGDPIRADKLLTKAQQSLSGALDSGMRGVSVMVTADAAAGGFIKPDDFVDVVLVNDANGQRMTRTVLRNVRVLAINAELGPATTGEANEDLAKIGEVFKGQALATLELNPTAVEVLVRAAASGRLTLVLRPLDDSAEVGSEQRDSTDQSIRLTSAFWTDGYSPGLR